jgi:hypothetical protein
LTIKNNLFVDWYGVAILSAADYNMGTIVDGNSFISGGRSKAALGLESGYDNAGMIASNNYFGTTDIDKINSMIIDRSDSFAYASIINSSYTVNSNSLTPTLVTPITSTITHKLDILVDRDIFGKNPVLLRGLNEVIQNLNGVKIKHTIEYNGSLFDYSNVDQFIITLIRNGEFTSEFQKEIAELIPSAASINYRDAVLFVGEANIDAVLIGVAGADGNFVL